MARDCLLVELEKMKYCPLCRRKWIIYEEPTQQGRAYFICRWCEISVWIQDPMIGLWETFEPVHCYVCRNHEMRFFCRMDGYCKWHCMNCGTSIEQVDPEKHKGLLKTVDEVKSEFKNLTRNMEDVPIAEKPGGFYKDVSELPGYKDPYTGEVKE